MLLSHEVKIPFIMLLSSTILSLALCLGSIVYQIIEKLFGIGVEQVIEATCTSYENLKLSNSNLIYLISFVGGCLALLMFSIIGGMIAGMLRQVLKYQKQQKKEEKINNITNEITSKEPLPAKIFLTQNRFIFGYLLFCLGALGNLVNFGLIIGAFFVSFNCKQSFDIALFVISCMSGISMVSTIISFFIWMYLRSKIHKALRNMNKINQNEVLKQRNSIVEVEMKQIKKEFPEAQFPINKERHLSNEVPIITIVPPVKDPPLNVSSVQKEVVPVSITTNIEPEYQTFKPGPIAVFEKVVRSQGIQTNEQRLPVKIYYENEADGTQLVKTMYYPNENQLSEEVYHKEMYPRAINRRIESTANFNQNNNYDNGLNKPLIKSRSNIYGDNVYHEDGYYSNMNSNSRRSYGEMGDRPIPVAKPRQNTNSFSRYENERYVTNRRTHEDKQFDDKNRGRDKYENIDWHTNEESGLSENEGDESYRELNQGRANTFADQKEKKSNNRKTSKSPPKQNKLKSPPKQKLQISPIITTDLVENSLQKTDKVSNEVNLNNIPVGRPITSNNNLGKPIMGIQQPKNKNSEENRLVDKKTAKNNAKEEHVESKEYFEPSFVREKTPEFSNPTELKSKSKEKDSDEYSKLVEQHKAQLRIKKEKERSFDFVESNENEKEREREREKERENMFAFESSYEMNKSFESRGSPKNKNIYLNYMANQSSIKPNSNIFRQSQNNEMEKMENVNFEKFDYDSVPKKRSNSQQRFEEEEKNYFESIKYDSTTKYEIQERNNQQGEPVNHLHKNLKPDLNESQAEGKYFDSSLNKSKEGKSSHGKTGLLIDYLRGKYAS